MDTKKLRQKILDLAIRGKLVPQNPNDEPASVLLERIRAEKERLIKEGKIKRSKKSAASDTPHYENEVPFEVPEGWEWCQVSDIFELNPKNDVQDDTPSGFIPMASVEDGFGYSHTFETRPWREIRKGYSHFQNGDIGIAKISPCFENRKSTIFYDLPNGIGAGTTELTVLRGHCVNTEFYLYLFQSAWYIYEGTKEFKGVVGQQRVNKEIFTTLLIPLPPIEEQERIVSEIKQWFSFIDILDDDKADLNIIIQKTKSKIINLAIHGKLVPQDPKDEPAIELLKRINPKFSPCDNAHYENVPKGWCTIRVGDLAEYTNGKAFEPSDWEQIGLPIIRIQNLNDENCQYNYTSITHEEKYRISHGDLLFAWAASLGVYIWQGNEAWLNQHIFKVEPHPFIDKQYLYYLFEYLVSEFYVRSHGSGMVHITKKEFETTIALLPPLSEQQRIITSIKSYYTILDNISANL